MDPELNEFSLSKNESEPLLQFSKIFMTFLYTFYLKLSDELDNDKHIINKDNIIRYLKDRAGINALWDENAGYAGEFRHAESFFRDSKHFFEKRYRFKLDNFFVICPESSSDCIYQEPLPVEVVLTLFPRSREAILLLNLALDSCNTDDIIFLRHCILEKKFILTVGSDSHSLKKIKNKNKDIQNYILFEHNQTPSSESKYVDDYIVKRYIKVIRSALEANPKMTIDLAKKVEPDKEFDDALTKTHLIEIRSISDPEIASPEAHLFTKYPKQIYGLLVGDEGWRFVPRDAAISRIKGRWSTRDFLSVISIDRNILMFNFALSRYYLKYISTQRKLRKLYGEEIESYFTSSYTIAGLQHGPLLSLEMASLIRFYIDNYESFFKKEYARSSLIKLIYKITGQSKLKKNLDKKAAVQKALKDISEANKIWEIKQLYKLIDTNFSISEDINALEAELKTLEGALQLEYEMINNRLIIILTIMGITIAIMQLLAALDLK